MSFYFIEATAFAALFIREPATGPLIRLMETVDDNSKLIAAVTPLEIYSAVRRRERAGDIAPEDAALALESLRMEAARLVQQPLNPSVIEAARQLIDRTGLRWPQALQLATALVTRDMFQDTEIVVVSVSTPILEAARGEGFKTLDPAHETPELAPAAE